MSDYNNTRIIIVGARHWKCRHNFSDPGPEDTVIPKRIRTTFNIYTDACARRMWRADLHVNTPLFDHRLTSCVADPGTNGSCVRRSRESRRPFFSTRTSLFSIIIIIYNSSSSNIILLVVIGILPRRSPLSTRICRIFPRALISLDFLFFGFLVTPSEIIYITKRTGRDLGGP